MIQLASLTVDHLKRLELALEPATGQPFFLPQGDADRWLANITKRGAAFALIAEDGRVLGAVMLFDGVEVYAIMGWRAGPRMVAITRQVRGMLDGVQSVGVKELRVKVSPGVDPSTSRWLRVLGFRLAERPFMRAANGVFMVFRREYAGHVEPATIE